MQASCSEAAVRLYKRYTLWTSHPFSFAVLMAQDLWVVPVMALVPILAHTTAQTAATPLWDKIVLVVGVIAGIFVIGRYLLPTVSGYCASRRQRDAFSAVLILPVIAAAWSVNQVGISMTLGAFLLGMLLSASDFRYQIESSIAPFKRHLDGAVLHRSRHVYRRRSAAE